MADVFLPSKLCAISHSSGLADADKLQVSMWVV
jgi:hypothetical protein